MYAAARLLVLIIIGSIYAFPQVNPRIVTDLSGNTYAAGNFNNESLNFGTHKIINKGGSDIYIAKYDPNGKILWASGIGGSGNEKLQSLSVNQDGNVSVSALSYGRQVELAGSLLNNNSGGMVFNAVFEAGGGLKTAEVVERKNYIPLLKTSGTDTLVTLVSPEAGEVWKVGTKATVTWISENVNSVLIELSTDSGNSWNEVHVSDLFDFENQYSFVVPNNPSASCLVKISDYYNPSVSDTSGLFIISGQLFWEVKETGFSFVLVNSFLSDSKGWMAGLDGLIRTTDNGETWSSYLSGFGLLDVFFLNDSMGWTAGLGGVIFQTTDGGENWMPRDSIINSYLLKIFFADDSTGYMIGGNNFLRTTDGGESWDIMQPTDHTLMTMFFINKDEGWIAGNEGVILKTSDGGKSWDYQQLNGTEYGTLTSVYFVDPNTGFASGSGLDVEGGVILKTTDSGNHWNLVHNGYNRFIFSIMFTTPDSGWASGDEGIMFNTSDAGQNWELQGSGTFDDLLSVNIKPNSGGWTVGNNGTTLKYKNNPPEPPLPVELINFEAVHFDNGVMLNWMTASEINNKGYEIEKKRSDEMQWLRIGFMEGKGTVSVPQYYSFTDKNVKPGTYYYRLKQIDYDGSFIYTDPAAVTTASLFSYKLNQNFPNPFNPSTMINFSVRENVHVTLKVYDALGSEAAILVNEEKPAGDYHVSFNAANFASGVYFYVFKAGSFTETKKMLLLK